MADDLQGADRDPASREPRSTPTPEQPNEPAQPGNRSARPEQITEPIADSVPERSPEEGYALAQRRLHWIVAALVAVQLGVGVWIGITPRQPPNESLLGKLLTVHLTTGTVIFGLMCIRLQMRRRLGVPPPLPGTPSDAVLLARINHQGFYILLLTMPVLGWLAFITNKPAASLFAGIHGALALTLAGAICAHIAGVIYHTYIRRDGLLRRMTL